MTIYYSSLFLPWIKRSPRKVRTQCFALYVILWYHYNIKHAYACSIWVLFGFCLSQNKPRITKALNQQLCGAESHIRFEQLIRWKLSQYFHMGFPNYHLLWFVFAKKYELWLWWCDVICVSKLFCAYSLLVLQSFHICKMENAMTITFFNTFNPHSEHCVNKH